MLGIGSGPPVSEKEYFFPGPYCFGNIKDHILKHIHIAFQKTLP